MAGYFPTVGQIRHIVRVSSVIEVFFDKKRFHGYQAREFFEVFANNELYVLSIVDVHEGLILFLGK